MAEFRKRKIRKSNLRIRQDLIFQSFSVESICCLSVPALPPPPPPRQLLCSDMSKPWQSVSNVDGPDNKYSLVPRLLVTGDATCRRRCAFIGPGSISPLDSRPDNCIRAARAKHHHTPSREAITCLTPAPAISDDNVPNSDPECWAICHLI